MSSSSRSLKQAQLILASASPRRSMLLAQLGLTFKVDPSTLEEVIDLKLLPAELVESLSAQKAADVALRHSEADLVLGADTVVVLDRRVLGKPIDRADAHRMLSEIAGRWHQVYTGYTLIRPRDQRRIVGHTVSEVRIRALSSAEIEAYIDTGEPMDKAGSYAIQEVGTLLVAEIKGCYTNIVGLPLPSVDAAWRELGWSVL
jgi:septum formation protein